MKLRTGLCFKDHVGRRCLWPSHWFYRNVVCIYIYIYRERERSLLKWTNSGCLPHSYHICCKQHPFRVMQCHSWQKTTLFFCGTAMVSKDTSILVCWIKSPTRKIPSPAGESPPIDGHTARQQRMSRLAQWWMVCVLSWRSWRESKQM